MKLLNDFVYEFINEKLGNVEKIGNKFYLIDDGLKKISQGIKRQPKQIGIYLGENTDEGFSPSNELLRILSEKSNKKIYVSEKAEWQFLNKKDIIGRAILKADAKKGFVLVQNKNDENLGYGKVLRDFSKKEEIVVKNMLDKGEYLRIER